MNALPEQDPRRQRMWRVLVVIGILLLVLVPRIGLLRVHPLWVDEVFSLAVATGHSLEHPAADADPGRGDFVEFPTAVPAERYQQYAWHKSPPARPGEVLRAVFLSDTSPPLYYLVLWGWTQVAGASDAALRGLSLLFTLLCLPLLWSVGRRMGGRRVALMACVLMALNPAGVYYATEGRMYAMLWFLALVQVALTLRVRKRRSRHGVMIALWIFTAAAGLMTHYFLAFIVAACATWLLAFTGSRPRDLQRRIVPLMLGAAGQLVLGWYVRLPEALSAWRVTHDWLNRPPNDTVILLAPARLLWSMVSVIGPWWGPRLVDKILFAAIGATVVLSLWRLNYRLFTRRRLLLWLCVAAACIGPLVFDLLRGTYVSLITRYALPGLPAVLLLAAIMLASRRIPRAARLVLLVTILGCWLTATRHILLLPYRVDSSPFAELAREITADARPGDVVIIQSIPSGVIGMSRYLPPEMPVISWVSQLDQRRVEDLPDLIDGYRRVILVRAHTLGEPAPQRTWLVENTRQIGPDWKVHQAWLTRYEPAEGDVFTSERR